MLFPSNDIENQKAQIFVGKLLTVQKINIKIPKSKGKLNQKIKKINILTIRDRREKERMYQLKKQLHDLIHPLENLRKHNKLTQAELALKVNLTKTIIGRFERGLQIPTYDEAKKLGSYFDLLWWQFIELCIDHREKRNQIIVRLKLSEPSSYSTVCTNEQYQKCGAR